MSYTRIDIDLTKNLCGDLRRNEEALSRIKDALSFIQSNIDSNILARRSIGSRLQSAFKSASIVENKINGLRLYIDNTVNMYCETDRRLLEKAMEIESINGANVPSFWGWNRSQWSGDSASSWLSELLADLPWGTSYFGQVNKWGSNLMDFVSANMPSVLDYYSNYDDVSTLGTRYSLTKIKEALKNGEQLTAQQLAIAKKFIPSVAAKNVLKECIKGVGAVMAVGSGVVELYKDLKEKKETSQIVADVGVEVAVGLGTAATCAAVGAAAGSIVPGAGNVVGAVAGFVVGLGIDYLVSDRKIGDKSIKDWGKYGVGKVTGAIGDGVVNGVKEVRHLTDDIQNLKNKVGDAIIGRSFGFFT